MADYVVVMYAGRVVEKGTAEDIFHHPSHPYTIGLMKSKPVVGKKVDALYNIPGKRAQPGRHAGLLLLPRPLRDALHLLRRRVSPARSASATPIGRCYRYYEGQQKLERGGALTYGRRKCAKQ